MNRTQDTGPRTQDTVIVVGRLFPVSCVLGPVLFLAVACSHAVGRPLRPGEEPTGPPVGLRVTRELVKGVLAYDLDVDATGTTLASVELAVQFELVFREL